MSKRDNDRPIFVTGAPRSGTTLLQLMLHSHPRIAVAPETRFALDTYRHRLAFGDLAVADNRRAIAEFIFRPGHKLRDLGLDRRRTKRRIVLAPPTVGSAIGTVFQAYANRFDRPRWGDKWPPYHRYIEVVLRLFPDAYIVHVVRDPRDCVASLMQMPWWKRSVFHAISGWAQSIDHTEVALRRWPGSLVRVQYERLVADPERELAKLAEALGEEYDSQMAEPDRIAPTAVPEWKKGWHEKTELKPTTSSVGRWRTELEPWEVVLCERVLARKMARFGYERSTSEQSKPRHLAHFYAVYARRKALRQGWLVQDRVVRRKEPNPVAARLTSTQRSLARVG